MDIKKYETELHAISLYCGRTLSKSEVDFVVSFAEEGKMPIDVMMEAFVLAAERTSSTRIFRYAQQIIYSWASDGVDSLDTLKAYLKKKEEDYNKENQKRKQYRQATVPNQEPVQPVKHEPYYKSFDRTDLKPCPFCGSDKIAVVHQHSGKFEAYYSKVECGVCGASTRALENFECDNPESDAMKNGRSVSEVVELWNNRI